MLGILGMLGMLGMTLRWDREVRDVARERERESLLVERDVKQKWYYGNQMVVIVDVVAV